MVTLRNTKQEILGAYEKAMAQLKAEQTNTYNPAQVKAEKEREEVLTSATENITSYDSFEHNMTEVAESIQLYITEALTKLNDSAGQLTSIEEAIKIKKTELEELTGIEAEVNSLAGIIAAKAEIEAQSKETRENTIAEHQARLEELRGLIADAKEEYEARSKEIEDRLKKEDERKREELEYEFDRRQRQVADEIIRLKEGYNKEVAESEANLKAQEDALNAREEALAAKESEIAEFPNRIEKEVAKAVAIAKNQVKSEYELQLAKAEAESNSTIAILTNKVEVLEASLITEREAHRDTAAKLETAYGRMEKVATASVEGARTEETVNRLLSTMNDNGKK